MGYNNEFFQLIFFKKIEIMEYFNSILQKYLEKKHQVYLNTNLLCLIKVISGLHFKFCFHRYFAERIHHIKNDRLENQNWHL